MEDATIIVAIIAIIPGLVLVLAQSRNRKADVIKTVSDAYSNLSNDLRLEIDRLSEKLDEIEKERQDEMVELQCLENIVKNLKTIIESYVKVEGDLREGVLVLREQVVKLGGKPSYELPPEMDFEVVEES
jgi:uncharacterized membrane protein